MTTRISSSPRSTTARPGSRGQAVLSAIIKEHLVTGEAVGSHALSDRFEHAAGWSSATIRYVMGELEEAGLLEQPHTSAGRIPTDQGYRYYVDNILDGARLSRGDRRTIESIGHPRRHDFAGRRRRLRMTSWSSTRARPYGNE